LLSSEKKKKKINDKKMLELVLIAFVVVIISLLAVFTFNQYQLHQKYKHIPGPPIRGLAGFFLGNVIDMGDVGTEGKSFAEKLFEWLGFS
jgi:heme/copper-type cytochrome/quinol oxidase subunit 2